MPAWVQGYTGKNIVIAVIDEDMEIAHEDLSPNVLPGLSFNGATGSSDPSFDSSDATLNKNGHGTAVSGIIAAAKNDLGGRGLAFDAKLVGYNFLHPQNKKSESFYYEKVLALDTVHVVNGSYGAINGLYISKPYEYEWNQIYELAKRKVVIVRSMGNEYNDVYYPTGITEPTGECRTPEHSTGTVDCFENFKDSFYESPFVITAGAMNSNGGHTEYGSTGSNLLLSAFGGDSPKIVTTDRTGCQIGYDSSPTSDNKQYDSCKYSSRMNGTSSAAPELSGIAAIVKSVNPELSTLQTKYIMIKSAQNHKMPDMDADTSVTTTLGSRTVKNHDGWITNHAGYKFNNKYGFGVPDAAVAVDIAENCSKDAECVRRANIDDFVEVTTSDVGSCIRVTEESGYNRYRCQFNLSGLTDNNDQAHPNMQIEDVALVVNGMTFKADSESANDYSATSYSSADTECRFYALSNTQIELTSPYGTHSILKHLNSYSTTMEQGALLLSHAFYQEQAKNSDVWTIDVITKNKLDLSTRPLSFGFMVFGYDL